MSASIGALPRGRGLDIDLVLGADQLDQELGDRGRCGHADRVLAAALLLDPGHVVVDRLGGRAARHRERIGEGGEARHRHEIARRIEARVLHHQRQDGDGVVVRNRCDRPGRRGLQRLGGDLATGAPRLSTTTRCSSLSFSASVERCVGAAAGQADQQPDRRRPLGLRAPGGQQSGREKAAHEARGATPS
jgi:hypothetical protein